MEPARLAALKREVEQAHGPWTAYNLHLGGGVYTMGTPSSGVAEANIQRVGQVVSDLHAGDLAGLRVLDLGAYEGGFSVELAAQGATVTAVEVRPQHAEKIVFAAQALGLSQLEVIQADVRDLDAEFFRRFDVILCLGLLYHLPAEGALRLLGQLADSGARHVILQTQVSLRPAESTTCDGRTYSGMLYAEHAADPGAAADSGRSFWFTRLSLLRALSDCGFTSVHEVAVPAVPELLELRDNVTYVAMAGRPVKSRTLPGSTAGRLRVPEHLRRWAHPAQGRYHRLRERWLRARGGGQRLFFRGGDAEG